MSDDELLDSVLSGDGPGSQLWRIFSRLGMEHRPDCSCLILADTMNELGPQGCRENRAKLLKLMYKNQKKYGWYSYIKAGINATVLGWAFKLNPLDPIPGLLDKAIALAEEQQRCQSLGHTG